MLSSRSGPVRTTARARRAGGPGTATGLEIVVFGAGPVQPQSDTPASGILVRRGDDAVLLDCGPGVIGPLRRELDPRRLRGVVISHLHADHFLDLVGLRYLFPWRGLPRPVLPVFLPPGGRERLAALETAISERPGFLGEALDLRELEPGARLQIGSLCLDFVAGRHYVPAWGVRIRDAAGASVLYTGDTGPSEHLARAAAGVDLLIVEATLADPGEDDEERGHLTAEEALAIADRAGAGRVLLTHFASTRRAALARLARGAGRPVLLARPGLRLEVRGEPDQGGAGIGGSGHRCPS